LLNDHRTIQAKLRQLFDMGLMSRRYGPEIGGKWAKDRLRDRLDQMIARE
jgi:hypothetical protein